MIASIRGTIIKKTEEFVVLVQGGIGFQIDMAPGMIARLPLTGEEVTIYTHLHVRENEMGLFGFNNEEEKNLFTLVQTVSGVGPKLALSVVDTLSPDAFALAVLQGDTDSLTQVKGIGKKGAARMILELTDKLKKSGVSLPEKSQLPAVPGMAPTGGSTADETAAALMVLGYSSSEARDAIRRAGPQEDDSVETLLRRALSQLSII